MGIQQVVIQGMSIQNLEKILHMSLTGRMPTRAELELSWKCAAGIAPIHSSISRCILDATVRVASKTYSTFKGHPLITGSQHKS